MFSAPQIFVLTVRKNCVKNTMSLWYPFLNANDSLENVRRLQLGTHFCYMEV